MPALSRPARVTARVAAVAALAVVGLHTWAAVRHRHDVGFSLLIGIMALGCVWCAGRCLTSPCRREVTSLLGMSAAMVAAHVVWLLASGGHDHGGPVAVSGEHTRMILTMLGLAAAEVVVMGCCAVSLRQTRSRTPAAANA